MSVIKTLKENQDIRIILVAILYYLAARLGFLLAFQDTNSSPVWPPSGIGFALILLLGRRSWPGITIGALVANALVFMNNNDGIITASTISASTLIAAGNTIEVLLGYFLFKNIIKTPTPFAQTKNTIKFLLISLVICCVNSMIGTGSLFINGIIDRDLIVIVSLSSFIGDLVGVLIFTPFILSWFQPFELKFSKEKTIETFLFVAFLGLVIFLSQIEYVSGTMERSLPFLVIPFLLWLAFSFNLQISMVGMLLTSTIAIFFTIQGQGPFLLDTTNDSLLLLQIFMGVITITTLVISSTVNERSVAQKTIKRFNENLEAKILERTKKLNEEITTRKKAEERIKISNRKLKKTNVELDSFVYSVSHDLRAPIASVQGLLNIIKKENNPQSVSQYLEMIARSMDQQDHFIREILDLSRNARLTLEKDQVVFKEIVEEVFEQLQFNSGTEKIDKKITVHQDGPFVSDQRRLKVIFNNLISNAIRYSNGKKPKVAIDIDVGEHEANITIKDNGKGIAKEHMGNVFKMFYRATDTNAGSGLGLYIVKETVEKMRGNIKLDSEEGKGTTVNLQIPGLKASQNGA